MSADVVVVGSGPAGCTAAILLARAGNTVALLEAHRDPAFYKRLCTHALIPHAASTIGRLGLEGRLLQAGAIRSQERIWTRDGWVANPVPGGDDLHGYGVRRQTLDPLLRAAAARTPGVKLLLGTRVTGLSRDAAGRVNGAIADTAGSPITISSRLLIGADGAASRIAGLAGLKGRESSNDRFGCFAYYRGVQPAQGWNYAVWIRDRGISYLVENDDGVTLLAAIMPKQLLPAFQTDQEATLRRAFADLSDGPDMSRAQRVSSIMSVKDYPSITRRSIAAPGVALVGDAAMVFDPLWGAGCAWAFQSAEWLSDAVAAAVAHGSDDDIDAAARRYQRQHRRRTRLHQWHAIDFSRRCRLRAIERLVMAGGARDPWVARRFWDFHGRRRSVLALFSPAVLARAAIAIGRTAFRDRSSHPPVPEGRRQPT